jgi:hypothetical protein
MTEEQLLEFTSTLGIRTETLTDKHGYDFDTYVLSPEQLLKFARAIYDKGYDEGQEAGYIYRDNFDKGYANRN